MAGMNTMCSLCSKTVESKLYYIEKKLKKSIWRRVIEFIEPCKPGRAVQKRELLKRVLQYIYIYNSLSIS